MIRQAALAAILTLAGCVPIAPNSAGFETATRAFTAPVNLSSLPAMKTFATRPSATPHVSNADLAVDFIDLSFQLESGRALPVLTRFETPITVRIAGRAPALLRADLTKLLYRLRNEAGISINPTQNPNANITIHAVSRAEIQNALPHAACFVVPNVDSLKDYTRARRAPRINWSQLSKRKKLAIFLPNDSSPQETRDCLHEELAQALGPLNDLYRLPNSVFNDDDVHTVLTAYDMLVLRAYYHPNLRSGMTKSQVRAALPAILSEINPHGNAVAPQNLSATPRAWVEAVQTALGTGSRPQQRQRAVHQLLQISERMQWQDHRRGFAHYAAGRLAQAHDPRLAQAHFHQANAVYASAPQTALHRAYVATQLAAHKLAEGQADAAMSLINPHLDTAAQAENAALLSTLLLLKAEALELSGQHTQARSVRLDSLGWARYGFGPDWAVRAKQREVTSLNPNKGRI
ncbi:MAG: DUF2927 domain-containing protein [Paracoccaceae bacterium]